MRMKKLLTFLTLLTLSIGVTWAADRWVQTDPSDLTTGDIVVIAEAGYKQAMTNNNGTSSAPSVVSYTLNSDLEISSTVSENMQWVVTKNGNNFQFQVSGTSNYLYCTDTNNGVRVGTNANNIFTVTTDNTTYTSYQQLKNTATSRYLGVYNQQDWRCYTSATQGNIVNSNTIFYKKVSDGGTTETCATPTFSPVSGTYTEAQNVTINCETEGATIHFTTDGTTPDDSSTEYIGAIEVSETMTIKAIAVKDNMNNSSVATAEYTINDAEGINLPFIETFAEADGSGPSGDSWSGSTASGAFKSDNEGWAYNNGYAGDQCARFGKSGTNGYATTPLIKGFTANNEYTLTFKAGAWNGDGTTLSLSASNGTFKDTEGNAITSVTMVNNAWTDYEVIFVPSASTSTITFTSNKNRFFLDEVNVTAQTVTVADGYYLYGTFNDWEIGDADYKFTANGDGTYYLNNVTVADNVRFKIVKVENGVNTEYGASNGGSDYGIHAGWHTNLPMTGADAYTIAAGGDCYFTLNSTTPTFSVDKAPVVIRGSFDSWSENGETMTATASGWTITKTLANGTEFGFKDGWGTWYGGNGHEIVTSELNTSLDLNSSGNYVLGTTSGDYTITLNRPITTVVVSKVLESHAITTSVVTDPADKTGGTISADKETAMAGETVTLTINENNGYELTSVTVNGTAITATNDVYSFEMPDEAAEVIAYFAAKTLNITVVNDNTKGTVSGIPATSTVGSTISFTVTPNTGYNVSSVSYTFTPANGTPNTQTLTAPYSFNMPGYDVTVTVNYSEAYTEKKYQLITSTSELEVGKTYLIVGTNAAGDSYSVMGAKGDNRMSVVSTTPDSEGIITSTEAMNIVTLEANGNNYSLHAEEGYLNNSTGSNGIDISESPIATTITFDDATYEEEVVIKVNENRRLSFNDTMFRFYGSRQRPTYLYKEIDDNSVKAPVITPEGGTFLTSETPSVTVSISCGTDGATIYYTTDGTEPSATNGTAYTESFTVNTTTTVKAVAVKDGESSSVVSQTYNFTDVLIDPVVFSPIEGTYSGAQTLEMFSVNQNAKIYYTTDGSTPSATNGTLYSSSDVINLAVGNTYNFKAIAVVGDNCSAITEGTYVINTASSSGLNSIEELNEASTGSTKRTMNNPVQVIYMNTWRHKDGTNNQPTIPEYAYIRDNTGYSMVYFGNGWYNTWDDAVSNPKICSMGDWIPAGVLKGAVQVWSDGFHNELGGKNNANTVTGWPTATDNLQNTPIIPEELTNTNINAGWIVPDQEAFATAFNTAYNNYITSNNLDPNNLSTAQETAANEAGRDAACGTDGYIKYVQDGNVWGHYVHLRKNTLRLTSATNADDATDGDLGESGTRKKYSGFITDQSGDELTYYDAFYNFSGFNGTPNYSNDFFNEVQNAGGTFDVYGIVGFYGPKAADAASNYSPFEIFPIDFLYIYKPTFNISSGTYYETQTVTISCDDSSEGTPTIYYKTSDMEDYEVYIPGTTVITVDATTTIEAYAAIGTQYNDVMESVVNSIEINLGNLPQPIISPESQVKTVGETIDATIEFDANAVVPAGTIIYFTVDGSDPADATSARYEYTAANIAEYLTGIDETTTVRAIAYAEVTNNGAARGYYSREAEARTYTFVKSNGIVYDLVTDQTQLNESSVYVIVNKANNMAVSTTQNANNRGAAGVMFVNEETKTQVYGNDDVAQFTLKKVGNKWYMQTTNSNENGYLYVGNGNTLLTMSTAVDAAEATINIDADNEHQAHISFVYDNEVTRYLRYYNGGQAFSTYTSETSNLPVSLYYVKATPLANIEKEGVTDEGKNQYTIADQLIAVEYRVTADGVYLWCKDQGDVSINKTEIHEDVQVDFMKQQGSEGMPSTQSWDQSNWVVLKLTATNALDLASAAKDHYLAPASVTGLYVDKVNYMIEVNATSLSIGEGYTYTPNVYSPANFMLTNLNIFGSIDDGDGGYTTGSDQNYFFMNPKIQEVCKITYAEWNESGYFTVPYTSGFSGAFNLGGWDYNDYDGQSVVSAMNNANSTGEQSYKFHAVVNRSSISAYGPKAIEQQNKTPDGAFSVYPLDLKADQEQVVTAINTVDVAGNGEVKSVKYVNVAGIVSDVPFQGVNIVVTEYTDGTRTATKMLKR